MVKNNTYASNSGSAAGFSPITITKKNQHSHDHLLMVHETGVRSYHIIAEQFLIPPKQIL